MKGRLPWKPGRREHILFIMSDSFPCSRKKHSQGYQTVNESECNPTPARQKKVRFCLILFKGLTKERKESSGFFVPSANGRHTEQDRRFKENLERSKGKRRTTDQQKVAQIHRMTDPLKGTFYHQSFGESPHLPGYSKNEKHGRSEQQEPDCNHEKSKNSQRADNHMPRGSNGDSPREIKEQGVDQRYNYCPTDPRYVWKQMDLKPHGWEYEEGNQRHKQEQIYHF